MADTDLEFYLEDKAQFGCLNCTLPICREGEKGCVYAVKVRRQAYNAKRYQADREHLATMARERYRANTSGQSRPPAQRQTEERL